MGWTRIAGLSLLAFVGTQSAFAADLPVKAPPRLVPVVYNWTGFYIGVNAGYGWSRDRTVNSPSIDFSRHPSPAF